jgi:hypothetical protein
MWEIAFAVFFGLVYNNDRTMLCPESVEQRKARRVRHRDRKIRGQHSKKKGRKIIR